MIIKKQNDVNECGLVVLQSIHKHLHGEWININELKSVAYISDQGINIKNLVNLSKKYGVSLDPLEGNIEELYASRVKGFLISMVKNDNENHYVIIKLRKNHVLVWDPIKGKYKISKKEFKKIYLGIIMTFKAINYEPKKFNKMSNLILKEPTIVIILITSILVSIIVTFCSSIYMKIILDKIIPQKLTKELFIISLIFLWLGFLKVFNIFIKKYFSRKISININYQLTFLYINKINNAKLNQLENITKSDHLRRISLIESVSNFISNIIFIIFGDVVMLLLSTSILFWISLKLFSIVLITSVFSISITIIFNLFIKDEYSNTMKLNQIALTSNIESISSFQDIKEPDYKNYVHNKFRKNFIKYKYSESKIFWFKTFSLIWENLLDILGPIIIIFIASKLVFKGDITIGTMIMFVSLFRTFLHPLDSIAFTLMNITIGKENLNLLKYILLLDDEQLNEKGYISKEIKNIRLENIDFGFDKNIFSIKKKVLNKNVKLKGRNGIGKSSFLKLLSTRYEYSGNFFVNNIELDFVNKKDIRNRIFFSDVNYIPDVTVFEFITLLNPKRVQTFSENVNKYKLDKLFHLLKIDLSKTLRQNGSNFSSGQIQVIKLLRLLSKPYDLIMLDEATDNITKDIIKILAKAIKNYQKGIFIEISHNKKYISDGGEINFEKFIKN